MREILFRGKRKDGGIWMFGDLRQWSKTRKGICDYALKSTSEVDPKTVGQFTGLTDKNGKKIFEGDIFLVRGMEPWVDGRYIIEFSGKNHCWWLRNPYPRGCSFSFSDLNGFFEDGEIVGNIHDNPDLLEVSE